jgi:hypothetical protein
MVENKPDEINKICTDILKELSRKYVDWNGITNSYLELIKDAKIPSERQLALLNAFGIARLGMQLSETDTKLTNLEHSLRKLRLSTKSPR